MKTFLALFALILIGCTSSNHPANLPGGSQLLAKTPGPLRFTAPGPGTVYLRDADTGYVLWETRVDAGQDVHPDASSFKTSGHYELYFKPAEKRQYHPSYNP